MHFNIINAQQLLRTTSFVDGCCFIVSVWIGGAVAHFRYERESKQVQLNCIIYTLIHWWLGDQYCSIANIFNFNYIR